LRQFAAQSFSHVLRKTEVDQDTVALILKPIAELPEEGELNRVEVSVVQGVSDIFYEVMYGASNNLHSKSSDILEALLEAKLGGDHSSKFVDGVSMMVRFLFIKLFANIDTAGHLPLFEAIHSFLVEFDQEVNEQKLSLGLNILEDAVKYKFGSRVSHLSTIQVVESLSYLLATKTEVLKTSLTPSLKKQLASTLSSVFYFKQQSLIQIYHQS